MEEGVGQSLELEMAGRNRFQSIMKHIRLDKKITRSQRFKTNLPLHLTSGINSSPIVRLVNWPNEKVAIDEQLYPTK